MHTVLATITAASVLAHALLGCCAHAFATPGGREASDASCSEHAEHEHAHPHGVHHPGDEGPPCEDHACCHLKCQWLTPDVSADLPATLLSHAPIFDADQVASQCAATAWSSEISSHDSPSALPLRSHLALGVLLI